MLRTEHREGPLRPYGVPCGRTELEQALGGAAEQRGAGGGQFAVPVETREGRRRAGPYGRRAGPSLAPVEQVHRAVGRGERGGRVTRYGAGVDLRTGGEAGARCVLGPVVHRVVSRRVHMDPSGAVHHGAQAVLDLSAAQVPPAAPGPVRLPYAGAEPLLRVAHEEVDAAVRRGDGDGDADAPALVPAGRGGAETAPGAEAAARGLLLQQHDLALVVGAVAAERGEAQPEQEQPAVARGGRTQGRGERAAAEVVRRPPHPVGAGSLVPPDQAEPGHGVRGEPSAGSVGDDGTGAGVAVAGGADPALPVGQRPVAAHVVVAAPRRVAALPVGRAAVGDEGCGLLVEHAGRQVLRPVPVVVPAERGDGEARYPAAVPAAPGDPADHRRPGEAGRGGVVGVVGVPLLLTVRAPDRLGAVLDVRVRVQGVHDGGPEALQQSGEDVDQSVVRVRAGAAQR